MENYLAALVFDVSIRSIVKLVYDVRNVDLGRVLLDLFGQLLDELSLAALAAVEVIPPGSLTILNVALQGTLRQVRVELLEDALVALLARGLRLLAQMRHLPRIIVVRARARVAATCVAAILLTTGAQWLHPLRQSNFVLCRVELDRITPVVDHILLRLDLLPLILLLLSFCDRTLLA